MTKPFEDLTPEELEALRKATREADIEDVRSGKRKPEYFHFIPPEWARNAKVIFPEFYRPSKKGKKPL